MITTQPKQNPVQKISGIVSRYAGKIGNVAKAVVDNYSGKTVLKDITARENDPKSVPNQRKAAAKADMKSRYTLPKAK